MRIVPVRIALLALVQATVGVGISTAQVQLPLSVEKTDRTDSFRLSWNSELGKTYFLQLSNALDGWNYFP